LFRTREREFKQFKCPRPQCVNKLPPSLQIGFIDQVKANNVLFSLRQAINFPPFALSRPTNLLSSRNRNLTVTKQQNTAVIRRNTQKFSTFNCYHLSSEPGRSLLECDTVWFGRYSTSHVHSDSFYYYEDLNSGWKRKFPLLRVQCKINLSSETPGPTNNRFIPVGQTFCLYCVQVCYKLTDSSDDLIASVA